MRAGLTGSGVSDDLEGRALAAHWLGQSGQRLAETWSQIKVSTHPGRRARSPDRPEMGGQIDFWRRAAWTRQSA